MSGGDGVKFGSGMAESKGNAKTQRFAEEETERTNTAITEVRGGNGEFGDGYKER